MKLRQAKKIARRQYEPNSRLRRPYRVATLAKAERVISSLRPTLSPDELRSLSLEVFNSLMVSEIKHSVGYDIGNYLAAAERCAKARDRMLRGMLGMPTEKE